MELDEGRYNVGAHADKKTRKRKRSVSPTTASTTGASKKSQCESLPKLNSRGAGDENIGAVSKNSKSTNGRKKPGQEKSTSTKFPVISENGIGKASTKLPTLKRSTSISTKVGNNRELVSPDKLQSCELLILPHVKPLEKSKVTKSTRKNVWE